MILIGCTCQRVLTVRRKGIVIHTKPLCPLYGKGVRK